MLDRSDLHAYQSEQAIPHILEHERCAVWAPMGGGKGVITLTALDDLSLVENDVWPALVLGTKRIAKSVWPFEPGEWGHLQHLTVSPVVGTVDERRAALRRKAHIYSINYENLGWLIDTLGPDWPFKTVIADEATKLKSVRTEQGGKNSGALRDVVIDGKRGQRMLSDRVRRFINLTGTPSPNGLKDLWGQTYFLDAGARLGTSFTAFEQRWFRKGYDGYSLEPMPHAEREIHGKLRDICLTVEGLKVDEPLFNNVMIDMPASARLQYAKMEKDMFFELEGSIGVEAFNAAAKTSKLLQLCAGAVIHDSDNAKWEEVHDAKLDALEDAIEEAAGAPVLVAYHFKADLARIRKRFPKAALLGDDHRIIEQWNDGKIPILLAHPASAGHGLNLARGGNILVFFSVDWNLETYMQIIERVGPMRQKQAGFNRPVHVHHILARNTIDEDVLERLRSKRTVQDVLLDAMRRRK